MSRYAEPIASVPHKPLMHYMRARRIASNIAKLPELLRKP